MELAMNTEAQAALEGVEVCKELGGLSSKMVLLCWSHVGYALTGQPPSGSSPGHIPLGESVTALYSLSTSCEEGKYTQYEFWFRNRIDPDEEELVHGGDA